MCVQRVMVYGRETLKVEGYDEGGRVTETVIKDGENDDQMESPVGAVS